jgi:uncharacterized membrane protein YgcG
MINLIAYNIPELEKKMVLLEAKNLFKSNVLNEEQWTEIQKEFATKFYTPTVVMKVLLFMVTLIGMFTIMGPIGLIVGDIGEFGYQLLSFLLGISFLFFTEKIWIKEKFHYKSGVTEAGIYAGLSFIAFGLLGFKSHGLLIYPLVGFLLAAFAAIRYLNLTALLLTIGFFVWILFQILSDIGGVVQVGMPFIFMISFGLIYWSSKKVQARFAKVFLNNQFIIIQTCSLVLFYIAGNYFVVRELSVRMLDLTLSGHQDIPFAFVFYGLTVLVPLAYIYWGIKQKSILFIRVALLTIALSVLTLKYYFSLGMPIVTITVSGAILVILALLFLNYLKQVHNGYTREKLLKDKWSSPDIMAVVASQTLGGNQMNGSVSEDIHFGGGNFGGGGAGGNW